MVFHPIPFRFSFDPPNDTPSVSTAMGAYAGLPGPHLWSTWDLLATFPTSERVDSEVEDDLDPDFDFSGLHSPRAMQHFLSTCDYYLSNSSDDEGYDPTRECFYAEIEELEGGNQLGMPRDNNVAMPRAEASGEREEALTPAGSQGAQVNQLHEMQAKLAEEQQCLQRLQQVLEQGGAGRAPGGGARARAREVHRRINEDAGTGPPPVFNRASQNLAATTVLLRAMPEPSTTEGRRVQGEIKGLLQCAAVQQAESSASRLREPASEHRAGPSHLDREASVHPEPTRDRAPVVRDRLFNDHYNDYDHDARVRQSRQL